MKCRFITILAAGLASAAPALAVTIDFEGPTSFASINQFYAGGTDSAGASGPNLGVSFGGDALAIQNDVFGPYFSNAPSPIGVMSPVGPDAAMNVLAGGGFIGTVSFYYSASADTTVGVWSGLNGQGTLLHTFNLAENAMDGCSDSAFCNWDLVSFNIGSSGSWGRSITFGAAANAAGFDDVSVSAVPEPASLALLTFGLAGLGMSRRRAGRSADREQVAA